MSLIPEMDLDLKSESHYISKSELFVIWTHKALISYKAAGHDLDG